ncbi:CGNR zinc finger domain-containing protein [Yinghuangia soli]|uniref:CGNR zinc finger domain-containing protein n=1 Tax=Yinghuangia soli TaxID=2908204 RepID=A0AA41U5W7_9ACTN|nr:CGNR zinc finger domain-containing protein [Yinghuangia soli]MCF2532337.1 CGNR zinc finger domain-containing protein [Yinghuangia soli]
MDDRPLTGEPLALDLANTRWPVRDVLHDHLDDPLKLRAWLAGHGLDPGTSTGTGPSDARLREALATAREAIRAALEQHAYEELDAVLARGAVRLGITADGPAEHVEIDDEAWRPAWESARAYLELVQSAEPGRIRNCAAPECTLWFLDTSKNGRRRWCSMAQCGNRAKARTHYARGR